MEYNQNTEYSKLVAVYHKLSYIMFSCVGNDISVLVGVAEVDKTVSYHGDTESATSLLLQCLGERELVRLHRVALCL